MIDRLGARLRQLRLERGLQVAALAQSVGCDRTMLYHVETGRSRISLELLDRLTRALGVELLDAFVAVGYSARHDLIESTRRMTHADLQKLARAISGK